jgi:hypothetical protein
MGYDYSSGSKSIELPLYYLYTPIALNIYHVNNPKEPFVNGSGNDNYVCGHLDWPC